MSRDIHPSVLSNLEEDNLRYVTLVKMRFNEEGTPTYLRLNSSPISIYWDEGSGDMEYQGAGNLGSIETAEEGLAVQSYNIKLSLTGIDPAYIVKAAQVEYKNQPIIIYLANIDTDNTVIGDPIILFAGRMDTMDIEVSKNATISVTAVSRLSDWERPRGGRYNHYSQESYYAFLHNYAPTGVIGVDEIPLDEGFAYVDQIDGKEIIWGRYPGGGGGTLDPIRPPEIQR